LNARGFPGVSLGQRVGYVGGLRLALGCLHLHDAATVTAAADAGIDLFDTARAYGNEALVAAALAGLPTERVRRVVTKCGMLRDGAAWVPDGRASSIARDARTSREVLGRPADLLLLHAPDPRTPLSTSVRALAQALAEGQCRAIGLSNVSLPELDEAQSITDIAAVEVALGAYDDHAARSGLVRACGERGIPLLAHSPFGGPKRAGRLLRNPVLVKLANRLGASPAQVFLAYLLAVHPAIVPVVGATRVETARDVAGAATVRLDEEALAELDARFTGLGRLRNPPRTPAHPTREVVMVMGLAGAGKSTLATRLGGTRLNRDQRGGTLRGIVRALAERLAAGDDLVVVDNTYLGRATRADVIATAHEHDARVRCVFLDTPLGDAQINVIRRMLDRRGALLGPDEIAQAAKEDPNIMAPTALFRMARELEPPSLDEGFTEIDHQHFVRAPWPGDRPGLFVSLDTPDLRAKLTGEVPTLVFGWREGAAPSLDVAPAELAVCTHPSGPPRCWCRPPLPGLLIEFALRHGIDPRQSRLVGDPRHAAMAAALGIAFTAG